MLKYDIANDIRKNPNFYYPIDGTKVNKIRVMRGWDEVELAERLLQKSGEDRDDIKNTMEYQAVLNTEKNRKRAQWRGDMIISLCDIYDCTPADLCYVTDDYIPKVIFENARVIYFVDGERVIKKLMLVKNTNEKLLQYLAKWRRSVGSDEPYIRFTGSKIAKICDIIKCDPRYLCCLSEREIEGYVKSNEGKWHNIDGGRIKKFMNKQNLKLEEVIEGIKNYGKENEKTINITKNKILQLEEDGICAKVRGDELLALCEVLNCKCIQIYKGQNINNIVKNPDNKFLIRGDRLQELREDRGYSLRKLGDFIGCGKTTIHGLEKFETSYTSGRYIESLADALGCSIEYLNGKASMKWGIGFIREDGKESEIGFFHDILKGMLDKDIRDIGRINAKLLFEFLEILKVTKGNATKRKIIASSLEKIKNSKEFAAPNDKEASIGNSLFVNIFKGINDEFMSRWCNVIYGITISYYTKIKEAKDEEEVQKLAKTFAIELQEWEEGKELFLKVINESFNSVKENMRFRNRKS